MIRALIDKVDSMQKTEAHIGKQRDGNPKKEP